MYNRARFIILEGKADTRDSDAAKSIYGTDMEALGGYYGGFMSHGYDGPRPAHFFMFDQPTADTLAGLIKLVREGKVRGMLLRERFSDNSIEYDLDQIMMDIAHAMRDNMIKEAIEPKDAARCWEGVKVLEALAAS